MSQVTSFNFPGGPWGGGLGMPAIEAMLKALQSCNSGPSAPTNPVPGMLWLDTNTSPDVVKIRDEGNANWITLLAALGATTVGDALVKAASQAAALTALGINKPAFSGASVTLTGAAVDFTAIPAWVNRITLLLSGASLTGSDDILVQLGAGGVPVTSGYSSVSVFGDTTPTKSTSTAGFVVRAALATNTVTAALTLMRVGAGNTWLCAQSGFNSALGGLSGGGAPLALAGALDTVRVTRSGTNTFDAGSAICYLEG